MKYIAFSEKNAILWVVPPMGGRNDEHRRRFCMASEKKVWEIIRDAGFDPLEDRGIIVKYAPENLSGKIADFFSMEFYVLQLCREELVLVPFSTLTAGLKKEVTLQIPYADIRSVEVREFLPRTK